MEKGTLEYRGRTYPISKSASLGAKIAVAITPLITIFAVYLPSQVRNVFTSVICEETDTMAYYALILLVCSLCGSIFTPLVGRVGDLIGRKKVLLITLIPYIGSLVLIGTSKSAAGLIIGYGLMGISNMGSQATVRGMIMDLFEVEMRTLVLTFQSGTTALASMVGPYIASFLTRHMSAGKAMMSLSVLLLVAWFLNLLAVPDIRHIGKEAKIDYKGFLLFPFALGPICIALTTGGNQIPWSSPVIYILIAVSIVFSVIFYKVEVKEEYPVVNFTMATNKHVLGVVMLVFLLASCQALNTYFNLYCRTVLQFSTDQLGVIQTFAFIPAVLSPILGLWLAKSLNYRRLLMICGAMITVCSITYIILMRPGLSPYAAAALKIPQYLAVVASGASAYPYLGAILNPKERGMGVSLAGCGASLGTALFASVFAILFNNIEGGVGVSFKYICMVTAAMGIIHLIISATTIEKIEKK